MRRIVTGHDKSGKSVFVSDGKPPRILRVKNLPGFEITTVWRTKGVPAIPVGEGDPTEEMLSAFPGPGETTFSISVDPPEQDMTRAAQEGVDLAAGFEELAAKAPGLAEVMEREHPGMHTTDTIDYGIVLSGETWLELDDGVEVHLKPGDCVVQNGTRHAWRNRGSKPCVMAFVLVGAKRK